MYLCVFDKKCLLSSLNRCIQQRHISVFWIKIVHDSEYSIFEIDDIKTRLQKLNITKSPGSDGIHPRILYETANQIAYPFQLMFVMLILQITQALPWVLLVFGKVVDRIVLNRFDDKLNTSQHQFGFKKNHSTATCSMVLNETLNYYSANRSTVFCTMLDATKAFDRIQYCKLFHCLLDRCIPADVLRLLIRLYTCIPVYVCACRPYCSEQ